MYILYTDKSEDFKCHIGVQGGDLDNTTGEDRQIEVVESWKAGDNVNVSLYFSESRLLKEKGEDEWVNYLEKRFRPRNRYDCIFIPSKLDSHFEHRFVHNLGWALTRIKPISLVEYNSPSTLETWIPNVFVEISEYYDLKCKMLKQFKSQQKRSYFQEDVIKGFHTNFKCSKKGYNLVEQFNIKQLFT